MLGIKLKVSVNPGFLSDRLRIKAYDAIADELMETAEELKINSPIGATGELYDSWRINIPRRGLAGFQINAGIANDAPNSFERIVGRGPGRMPPESPLTDWVNATQGVSSYEEAKKTSFRVRRAIAERGTRRWREKNNFAGLSTEGKFISGGRLDQLQERIAAKIRAIKLSR